MSPVPDRPMAPAALGIVVLGLGVGLGLGACARPAAGPRAPHPGSAWSDAPVMGDVGDPGPLGQGTPEDRVARLDRLLDLLDGARFAQDTGARDALWSALGGHGTGVGPEATREATLRLLQEALTLEGRSALSQDSERFLADFIMLVSADLELPETAEDLSIQTLAYRQVLGHGHRRVTDNARWRLYDHVRGCLVGATAGDPQRRIEVAVHALYSETEDITALLQEGPPHLRPPWPGLGPLWDRLHSVTAPLHGDPRWEAVLARRLALDEDLRQTLASTLPAARDPTWPLATLETGTARPESMAPVVLITETAVVMDAGRPQARTLPLHQLDRKLAPALGDVLAQDGRGIVLLAAPALTPSPVLHAALVASAAAGAIRVELGGREARLDGSDQDVVVALPLEVTTTQALGPHARAIVGARLHLHLEGRGTSVAVDGAWITKAPLGPSDLRRKLADLERAFPQETVVSLTLSPDVVYLQLFELLVAAMGGDRQHRPFEAVGWIADGLGPADGASRDPDGLDRRLALSEATATLDQPYPLRPDDQARVQSLAESIRVCLPEWEGPLPRRGSVPVRVVFDGGRATDITVEVPGRARGNRDAVVTCVRERAYALQLREHTDRVTFTIRLRPGAPK